MTGRFRFTPAQLAEIIDFIAVDNEDAARRVLNGIHEALGKLAEMPEMGHALAAAFARGHHPRPRGLRYRAVERLVPARCARKPSQECLREAVPRDADFSASAGEKLRRQDWCLQRPPVKCSMHRLRTDGPILANLSVERIVARTVAYLVALSLATGPMAAQMCQAFCGKGVTPVSTQSTSCHDPGAAASVQAACDTACQPPGIVAGPFLKQDLTGVFGPDVALVEPAGVPRRPATSLGSLNRGALHRSLEKRPLTLQFRI